MKKILFVLMASLSCVATAAPVYRPEQVRREINTDEYQLSVQKNNRIDLRTTAGEPIIDNAAPRVYFPDSKASPVQFDYRQSNRISVNTALGQGNGFHFSTRDGEWTLATYPAQSFLTIDFAYINATRKPVQVAGLAPLAIDDSGAVHLGPDSASAVILQSPAPDTEATRLAPESAGSPGYLAAYNPASGASLIAGFLTHRHGTGVVRLFRTASGDATRFDGFSAETLFDPPVTVEPGGRLEADTLYLAIVERNPQAGLERFVQASQRVEPFPMGRHAFHHGWQAPAHADDAVSQAALEPAHETLHRYGWTHLNLSVDGTGGLAALLPALAERAATVHAGGMTLGIAVAPPEGNLDGFLEALRMYREAGVDRVEIPGITAHDGAPDPRELMEALETAGIDTPRVVFTRFSAPSNASLQNWAMIARDYYLPTSGNPFLMGAARALPGNTAHFDDGQFITAWTLAALLGGPLRSDTPPAALSPFRRSVLSRLLPAPTTSARALDMFEAGPPRRWHLPLKTSAGQWNIIGLFNWDTTQSTTLTTPLVDLGLNNDNYYTVYDFWAGQYLGLIEEQLRVEVPPEGVRLLGLRRFEKRPMLIASDRHYAQGAADHTALDWSYEAQTLTGTFSAITDTAYTLTVLIPEPYAFASLECTPAATDQQVNGDVLRFTIPVKQASEASWRVTCGVGR